MGFHYLLPCFRNTQNRIILNIWEMIEISVKRQARVRGLSLVVSSHGLFRKHRTSHRDLDDTIHASFPLDEASILLRIKLRKTKTTIEIKKPGNVVVMHCGRCSQLVVVFERPESGNKDIIKTCSCEDSSLRCEHGGFVKVAVASIVHGVEDLKIDMSCETADRLLNIINGTIRRREDLDLIIRNISILLEHGSRKAVEAVVQYMEVLDSNRLLLYFPGRADLWSKATPREHMDRFWRTRLEYNEGRIDPEAYKKITREFVELDQKYNIIEELERQMNLINEIRKIHRVTDVNSSRRRKIREYKLSSALYFYPKTKPVEPTMSPFNPGCIISGILMSKIGIFSSSTFPLSVPLETNRGATKVIYKKGDDLTKDLFVLETVRYISGMMDLDLATYGVLILSRNEGMIEVIDGTSFTDIGTAAELKRHIKGGMGGEEREKMFIDSFCGYLVICYMMGVGDRNPGNMLVTKLGNFLHIDFSYIFGKDPKFFAPRVTVPGPICDYLREDELIYSRFISRSVEIFLSIRDRYPKVFLFWSVLVQSGMFRLDLDEVIRFTGERLCLRDADCDAADRFRSEIASSIGSYRMMLVHAINRVGDLLRR